MGSIAHVLLKRLRGSGNEDAGRAETQRQFLRRNWDSVFIQPWDWPTGTWFQERLRRMRMQERRYD
jgi:hypothetical protein